MEQNTNAARNLSWPLAGVALVVGAVVGVGGMYFFGPARSSSSSVRPVPPALSKGVSALGHITPKGGMLSLRSTLPGQVSWVDDKIKEGEVVEKGTELIKLASHDEYMLKWEMAKQQFADAKEQIKLIEESFILQKEVNDLRIAQFEQLGPINLKLQQAKIEILKQKADAGKQDFNVAKSLGTYSQQEIKQKELVANELQAKYEASKVELKKLEAANKLELDVAKAEKKATEAKEKEALKKISIPTLQNNVKLAKYIWDRTIIKAPRKGRIISFHAQVGEMVGGIQPIAIMADTANMMVIAEVYETDRDRVFQGQKVEVTGRALNQKLKGEVVSISHRIGKNQITSISPLAKIDRRITEVKIKLLPAASQQAQELIDHQVSVRFLSKED